MSHLVGYLTLDLGLGLNLRVVSLGLMPGSALGVDPSFKKRNYPRWFVQA